MRAAPADAQWQPPVTASPQLAEAHAPVLSRSGPGIFARVRPASGPRAAPSAPAELVAAEPAPWLGDVAYAGGSQRPAVAWSTGRELRFARRACAVLPCPHGRTAPPGRALPSWTCRRP